MATTSKRATVYFDPVLHRALRVRAAETTTSVSDLVNLAVREMISEDAEDLAAFEERANDPVISYEEMLERLRRDGRI